ncbi:MAG: AhpC/TSA family protein [Bacteroidales bacterium]|jgi:hypothetical protein|nr:AhpC/TSA family protein [Bacteroidales bacterium]
MKRFLLFLIPVILFSGCNKNRVFTVHGTVKFNKQDYIYLSRVDVNTPLLIDSSKISRKGNFRFRVEATEPDFYQVGYSVNEFITLLCEPAEKIKISFNDVNLYNDYKVEGSHGSELIQILDLRLIETKARIDSLAPLYDKALKEPGSETEASLLEQELTAQMKAQRKFNIEFIINNINSLAAIKALYQRLNDQTYVLYDARDLQYLKIVSDSLKKHYPESKHTRALVSDFEKEMNQMFSRQLEQISKKLPETKLDPDLSDINGKKVALSSLRGKYVLLAFWSAESRECITENLQLKEYYRMFRKKGFEIYQISLDKDEKAWKSAVKFDELPWISTRENDPDDPVNARLFNVRSVPANYLFDPEGNIIASNLHGKTLQIKLNQLFTK